MSAPVDIQANAAPKRPRRAAKPKLIPEAELTALELRAAMAVRRLVPEQKEGWVEILEKLAVDYELKAAAARPARSLRLVLGGAR